jgi:urease accessory protein UreE
LWDATLANRHTDIEATADQLIDVLWAALTPPDLAVNALQQFRAEVAEANRRFEEATREAAARNADPAGGE